MHSPTGGGIEVGLGQAVRVVVNWVVVVSGGGRGFLLDVAYSLCMHASPIPSPTCRARGEKKTNL